MSHLRSSILQELGIQINRLIQAIINPPWLDKSANQIRSQVTISSGTVSTVSSVTSFAMDTYQARQLALAVNSTAWAQLVRSRIS